MLSLYLFGVVILNLAILIGMWWDLTVNLFCFFLMVLRPLRKEGEGREKKQFAITYILSKYPRKERWEAYSQKEICLKFVELKALRPRDHTLKIKIFY